MSTVKKSTRLGAASTEFNVGRETLVKYLTSKGFSITDSPASKVTDEMYDALQIEYGHNIAVKSRSAEINLPKGSEAGRGKKEEEPARPVKKAAAPAAKPEAPVKAATPVAKAVSTPVEEESKPAVAAEEKAPAKAEPPVAEQPKAPVAEAPATPAKPEVPETKPAQPEVAPTPAEPEIKTPEPAPTPSVEEQPKPAAPEQPAKEAPMPVAEQSTPAAATPIGPTVVGKIDLSDIPSDGRGKRGSTASTKKAAASRKSAAPSAADTDKPATKKAAPKKTKEESAPVAEATPDTKAPAAPVSVAEAPVAAPAMPPATPVAQQPTQTTPPAEDPKVEHIEMKRVELEGPKILGKIELPVNDDRGGNRGNRKRIPLNKKPETYRPSGSDLQNRAGFSNSNQQNAQQGNRAGMRPNRPGGPGGPGQPGGPGGEVDKKEIQRKIQETQARLSGGGQRGGRNKGAKYRRDKRDMRADQRAAAENNGQNNVINVTEFISVSDLASLMNVSFAEVISKCMGLGMMVSINQRLDKDVIELVAGEFGYEVSFINLEQEADAEADAVTDDPDSLQPRAPVVTIMGHVDHGKTSLLDYIRSANVVAGEAGGITQHIGAYQVTTEGGKKVTFLDTPGHEAFTAMRARGAKVADIAVIVIAADDAIMPQTKEAISHAQAANLPMIFAINKIDKDGANPEKIREQLSAMNILVEEWGGKFQSQEISAKKGINVDLLIEKIGLEAELLELMANPDRNAVGSVIEASLDKGRGYVATMLVQSGTLKQGEMIVCGQHFGRVKAMLNERGQRVQQAGPSAPVQVLGLNGAPQAGEKFKMYEDEDEAKEIANKRAQILREQGIRARKHLTMEEIGRRIAVGNFKELPVIIKGDFDGSVEALSDALQKLSTEEVAVNVVHKAVGQITESDVLLATASDAIILGFQVRPSIQASRLAEQESIELRFYSIIYDAINDIKSAMEGLLAPKVEQKIVGHVEIREVYTITGAGIVAGCYVTDGKVERKNKLNLIRDGIVVFNGELGSLKRFKDDVKEVAQGYECGLQIKNYSNIKQGDIIEVYEEVEVKRTLGAPVA